MDKEQSGGKSRSIYCKTDKKHMGEGLRKYQDKTDSLRDFMKQKMYNSFPVS